MNSIICGPLDDFAGVNGTAVRFVGACADDKSDALPAPPVAKKVPKTTEINGRTLVDNYFWLRDKQNPEVAAYLQAENAYTDAVMKPTRGFAEEVV